MKLNLALNGFGVISGYSRYALIEQSYIAYSTRSAIDELWSALSYYCTPVGFSSICNDDSKRELFALQIRQAKEYYDAASRSSYLTKGLAYFYGFEHLVRAGLLIKMESRAARHTHGIRVDSKDHRLLKLYMSDEHQRGNIFLDFYQYTTTSKLLKHDIDVLKEHGILATDLFDWVRELSFQNIRFRSSSSNIVSARLAGIYSVEKGIEGALVGLYSSDILFNDDDFAERFDKILTPTDNSHFAVREALDMGGDSGQGFNAYIFKTKPKLGTGSKSGLQGPMIFRKQLYDLLSPYLVPSIDGENYDMNFSARMTVGNKRIYMIEPLAMYLLMYYISDIVRYKPQMIAAIFSEYDVDGLMFRDFLECAPLTFLRYVTLWCTGQVQVLKQL